MLDLNGDGRLSTEELIDAFKQFFPECNGEEEVASIMSKLDIDGNGFIDYTEFLLATINKKRLLSKERLMLAFAAFDQVKQFMSQN
jgi:calcium-dependent protein kinase